MNVKLVHKTGKEFTMPWRPEGRRPYTNTAASFLFNLARTERADWTVTVDGREVPIHKAYGAAAEEMNALHSGRRLPPLPKF